MLTALVQDPDQLDYQDVTCLWAVALVDRALPLERLLRDDRRMRQVCIENAHWPLVYLGGLLAALVRTLPADDPWRHLGARLDAYAGFPAIKRNVPAPPRHTGALMPDGRLFGGPDHPRSVSNDPEMDVEFAALAGGLAPEAAALFALSADGWNAAAAALTPSIDLDWDARRRQHTGVMTVHGLADETGPAETNLLFVRPDGSRWSRSTETAPGRESHVAPPRTKRKPRGARRMLFVTLMRSSAGSKAAG